MKSVICFAVAAVLSFAAAANAEVIGTVELVSTGNTTNAAVFDGVFDVYQVKISNTEGDATSATFNLPGSYINTADRAFNNTAAIPQIFGFDAPDSFLVLPNGGAGTQLAVGVTDDSTLLAASYSLPGTTPVVPSGDSIIAFLSVPEGFVPDQSLFSGRIENSSTGLAADVTFGETIPEPTSVLLAGLALCGVGVARRR